MRLEERLSEYWVLRAAADVARNIHAGTPYMMPAFASIVGKQRDAVGTSEAFGDNDLEKLEWIIGFLGYPCEPEYVTAVVHVMTQYDPEGHAANLTTDEASSSPDLQHGVMAWTYCLATERWAAKLLARFVNDDGSESWLECGPVNLGDTTARLIAAIREFDAPGGLEEARNRTVATDTVARDNGVGYTARFLPPGASATTITAGFN